MKPGQIHEAAASGDVETVRALLADDATRVFERDIHGKTPLHLAAEHDRTEVASVLIDAGADLEALTTWRATPLDWAGVLGSRDTGDVLRARGAVLRSPAAAGLGIMLETWDELDQALVLAGRNGHVEVIDRLLDAGANPSARGFFGGTALHWAAISGHVEAMRVLIRRGADPSLRDHEFDADVLGWAREGGHQPAVALSSGGA